MDPNIFSLISREDDKVKLWEDLAKAGAELICKGKEESVCKLRISFYNSKTKSLECTFASATEMKHQEEYLGHFFLGGEKYYFQALAHVHEGKIVVGLPKDLYHLQRRQNYRVRIPRTFSTSCQITSINGVPHKIDGRLMDLSSQGCRVVSKLSMDLKMEDHVIGSLTIAGKDPIEIQGLIRHVNPAEPMSAEKVFGIEFKPLSSLVENKLFALTMEIHKQVFKRLAI